MGEAVRTDKQDFPRKRKERALGDSHGQAIIEEGRGNRARSLLKLRTFLGILLLPVAKTGTLSNGVFVNKERLERGHRVTDRFEKAQEERSRERTILTWCSPYNQPTLEIISTFPTLLQTSCRFWPSYLKSLNLNLLLLKMKIIIVVVYFIVLLGGRGK